MSFLSFGRDPHPSVSKSDAGSDGTQPASCVDIQNHQSTYSCGCPMYRACQNNVFCSSFCSTTLAIRCRSKAPFVHERLKAPNTIPHGTCFHVVQVVSTPSNWKVSLMLCGNQMCPPRRISSYSDVQGPANQQTSFSGQGDECVAHKLPFSGHIIKKFQGPSILQLNIEGLTAIKMNVLHHLATQLETFVILLQETHCTSAEKCEQK